MHLSFIFKQISPNYCKKAFTNRSFHFYLLIYQWDIDQALNRFKGLPFNVLLCNTKRWCCFHEK